MAAYGRAVTLAEQDLRVNPRDAHAEAALALFLAKQGRIDEADRHLTSAAALGTPDATIWYRGAVVHTLAGRLPQALSDLDRAIQAGYSADQARTDDDLTPLREFPEFKRLTAARQSERSVR
jgi:Flp pilus assembly protein TadD